MKTLSLVLVAPERFELEEFDIPSIGPDEGLLRVELAGVCGTDYGFYHNKVTNLGTLPMVLGHEILGHIERIGEEASRAWKVNTGDRVVVESSIRCFSCPYCIAGHYNLCDNRRSYGTTMPVTAPPSIWGAYGQLMYLAPGTMLHKIAEAVPAKAAVLSCAVLANGIRWATDIGGVTVGSTVVVEGVGQQGLAAIVASKEAGAGLVIASGLSKDTERFELAKALGADVLIDVEREDPVERVSQLTKGRMADVVIDVATNPKATALTIDLARKLGTIVFASVVGSKTEVPLLTDKILFKELRVFGAFTHMAGAVERSVRLIESAKYPLERLVTHSYPLAEADTAVRVAGREIPGESPIKVVIEPR